MGKPWRQILGAAANIHNGSARRQRALERPQISDLVPVTQLAKRDFAGQSTPRRIPPRKCHYGDITPLQKSGFKPLFARLTGRQAPPLVQVRICPGASASSAPAGVRPSTTDGLPLAPAASALECLLRPSTRPSPLAAGCHRPFPQGMTPYPLVDCHRASLNAYLGPSQRCTAAPCNCGLAWP